MVRETRYLYVGNLPESITEERLLDLFSSYGKIQGIKILNSVADDCNNSNAIVAFMDIKSASKAQESEILLDDRLLDTQYNESSMTITVQTNKKESTAKQRSPVENDGIAVHTIKSKNILYGSPSIQTHLPNSQKFTNVHSLKYDDSLSKTLGMLFQGFPTRSTDSSIRDGLFHDYKKYGKVLSINVIGQGEERHAIISFKKPEDAAKALEASRDKKFFGAILNVFPHEGLEVKAEFRQQDEQDEYHSKASRTLFLGNLDRCITKDVIRDTVAKFGYIIDIDIKHQNNATYAFIQFDNIRSVVQALKDLEDEYIGGCKLKVGFGKTMGTSCIWIEGISDTVSEKYLALQHLSCYGCITALYIDRKSTRALAFYDNPENASNAVKDLKGRFINDKRIQVDFASRECQNMFLDAMEQSGQLRPGDRPEERLGRSVIPFEGPEFTRQWSFDPNHSRNRFFPYEGPQLGRGGYAGRPYFHPGRPSASRLPFYEGFEQRRDNGMGVRSSFKSSYDPLYEKDTLPITRNIKERSLSLERQRYRDIVESSLSRDNDVRYVDEWEILDDRESFRKLEKKKSRHHHKDKSPMVTNLDSKGNIIKKRVPSPSLQSNYEYSLKKQGINIKSSRSNNDTRDSWSHSKKDGSVESWIDLNAYEPEKGKFRNSPGKHKRLKVPGSDSKHISRKSKNYSDDSSCSSSASSDSLISVDSESAYSASKSSDEVDVLVKKKQELIKMLEAMEEDAVDQEDDCNDSEDEHVGDAENNVISKDVKDDFKKLDRSCSEDSFYNSSLIKSEVEKDLHVCPTDVDSVITKNNMTLKIQDITSPTYNTKTQQDNICLMKDTFLKIENLIEENVINRGETIVIKDCSSPVGPIQSDGETEALASQNLVKSDYVQNFKIENNEQPVIDECKNEMSEEKSYEPRNIDKSKKIREVMTLPLPRFAFDLPSLRKKLPSLEADNDEQLIEGKNHQTLSITESTMSPHNILSNEDCGNIAVNKCDVNDMSKMALAQDNDVISKEEIAKEESCCINTNESEEKYLEITNSLDPVPIKSDTSDCKVDKENDLMTSVLDDLRIESGDNFEDDTSLEERIRALDEKLSRIHHGTPKLSSSSLLQSDNNNSGTNTVASLDYREKYKRHRKEPSSLNVSTYEQQRIEPSDLAKILISRSSIFDQDTQRLEMLDKITQNDIGSICLTNIHDSNVGSVHGRSNAVQQMSQNVASNLFSGFKSYVPLTSSSPNSRLTASSSLGHLSNFPLASYKTHEPSPKPYPDNPSKTLLSFQTSGDPRRIAKPLELSTSLKLSTDVQFPNESSDMQNNLSVPQGGCMKLKDAIISPVSILKKGIVPESSHVSVDSSAENQEHSNKRKSEIAFGSDASSKQPEKVLVVDVKTEHCSATKASSQKHLNAGNLLTKSSKQAATPKLSIKSIKNKSINVLNKPIVAEKKLPKSEDIGNNVPSKKDPENSFKPNNELKVRENIESDERQASKEKLKEKQISIKRSSEDSKDDVEKKGKSVVKNNPSLDNKDLCKKEVKKDDSKALLNVNKNAKLPSKSKSLLEVPGKKLDDVLRDKSLGDKSLSTQRPEKINMKPKLKTMNDDGKDLKASTKSVVSFKDEKKQPKIKITNSTNKIVQEPIKKNKPNFMSSCSLKEKKEEKREVKALVQEHGASEEAGMQYVSMYDMVKRRSNKETGASKSKEERTKSLNQIKASAKRSQSRKASFRFSSNDSDSNEENSNNVKQKSRQKRISSSSSSSSGTRSSSSDSEDDDKDTVSKKSKKRSLIRTIPAKRKIFSDSSSEDSLDHESTTKTKKFVFDKTKVSESAKVERNKSPITHADLDKLKTDEIQSIISVKDEPPFSTSEDVLNRDKDVSSPLNTKDNASVEKNLYQEYHDEDAAKSHAGQLKNVKSDSNLSSESYDCALKFKADKDLLTIDSDSKGNAQIMKAEDSVKLDMKDCINDEVLLDNMDDDSNVVSLPGFEVLSVEVDNKKDALCGFPENSFAGILVVGDPKNDSLKPENVHRDEQSLKDVANVEFRSTINCCLDSEASEPVFDDVDTDNNTEEVNMAIESLFEDGEEVKHDQASSEKMCESIPSDNSCTFIFESNASQETFDFAKATNKMDIELAKAEVSGCCSLDTNNDSNVGLLNINKEIDNDTNMLKPCEDNFKENAKPKEFSGHFISTFKPEQLDKVPQTLEKHDIDANKKAEDCVDKSLPVDAIRHIDFSRKRTCDNDISLPIKKTKLDNGDELIGNKEEINVTSCMSPLIIPGNEGSLYSGNRYQAVSSTFTDPLHVTSPLATPPIVFPSATFPTTAGTSSHRNMEQVIEEVAKGNFERSFDSEFACQQNVSTKTTKDDVITSSSNAVPQTCINSTMFSSFITTTQSQLYPQDVFHSRHLQGFSQNVPSAIMPAQNISATLSSELTSQPQNIMMTGSGLVQVSSSNIPSIQHIQMYSAGLASRQLQQSYGANLELLPQHRLVRPILDSTMNFRPTSQQNNVVSTGIQQQMQMQHQMIQQGNMHSVHQRLPQTEKMIHSNQQRLQSVDAVSSTSMNPNLVSHPFQYQLRPNLSPAHLQIPSNSGQICNSFIQQQQQDIFNRNNLVFRGQMKVDQSFAPMDNLSQQAILRSTSASLTQSHAIASVSQMSNVGSNLPPTSVEASNSDGLQNVSRLLTKGECRQQQQQQLFIRPIIAMQQPLPSSSCVDQSSIVVGQHRMPFTVKEPRATNFSRAEPKTPGVGSMQQQPLMLGVVGSVGQPLQSQSGSLDSTTQQPSLNLFSGLTSPPVGILGSAVLIPPQQQQQQHQRLVQPATVFQYATPTQHINLHHLSNSSQLEFFVAGNRMVAPIIQALPTDSIISHGQQAQNTQGIHLPTHMQSSMMQQQRPNPENLDRGLAILSQKLPVVWQGLLALKNDSAHVQMHYVCGSKNLVQASLPDNVAPLRIAQRMRLEPTQLEQVTKRMNESDYSMLLAVPCGRDPVEIMTQSHNLQTFFIHYLQQKQAAGIVNILQPNSTQTAYVVHIFPPCDFSVGNLSRLPPDVVQNLVEGGYLLIIITTC